MDNTGQIVRIGLVGAWSALCGLVLVMWLLGASTQPGAEDPAALGCAAIMASGCVGTVWLGVLGVAALLYALVRK